MLEQILNLVFLPLSTQFLRAVLRQDIGWYDTNTTSDFASKMTEDLNKIQDGIGEKMGMLVRFIVTFLGSLIYPYTQNWLISLVIRDDAVQCCREIRVSDVRFHITVVFVVIWFSLRS